MVHRQAVRREAVAVRERQRVDVTGREHLRRIPVAQAGEVEVVLEPDARRADLVLAECEWSQRIEPTEVEETQRLPVHLVAVCAELEVALVEIPISDVVTRIDEDGVLEVGGDEIDPSLVDEQSLFDGNPALAAKTHRPPLQKRVGVA